MMSDPFLKLWIVNKNAKWILVSLLISIREKIRYNFFKNKGLLDSNSMEILAKLLWGLIYDGIFRYESIEKPSLNYLKLLDRIPETTLLKQYQQTFDCAPWIKYAITRKLYIIFYLYFKFKKSINKNIRLS